MRGATIVIVAGLCLITAGAVWGWYYSTVLFPSEQAALEHRCQGPPPTPCASLAASDGLGDSAILFGVLLLVIGAVIRIRTVPKRSRADAP